MLLALLLLLLLLPLLLLLALVEAEAVAEARAKRRQQQPRHGYSGACDGIGWIWPNEMTSRRRVELDLAEGSWIFWWLAARAHAQRSAEQKLTAPVEAARDGHGGANRETPGTRMLNISQIGLPTRRRAA